MARIAIAARSIHFREATEADQELLLRIYSSTRESEMEQLLWSDEEKRRFLAMQFQAQDTHYRTYYPGAEFLIILQGDIPVGRLYLYRSGRELRIMDITLLPSFRGQGIGSAILDDLHREAAEKGHLMSIHVEKENPARALYARHGFQETEDKGVYLLMVRKPPKD
jgi:ribosomal protein S18 acetylase RimI-like enzyme